MFYVGQKVVCIDPIEELKKDKVYVIDGVWVCEICGSVGVSVGIRSHNILINGMCLNGHISKNTAHQSMYEYYKASRFAPLEEYSDSMSIAMQLVQEIDQTDKQKIFNPKRETVKN